MGDTVAERVGEGKVRTRRARSRWMEQRLMICEAFIFATQGMGRGWGSRWAEGIDKDGIYVGDMRSGSLLERWSKQRGWEFAVSTLTTKRERQQSEGDRLHSRA